MKLDEARHLLQVRIAAEPDLLEGLFRPFPHAKAVHGDEHVCSPDLFECSRRASAQYRIGGEGSLPRRGAAPPARDGVELDGSTLQAIREPAGTLRRWGVARVTTG